MTKVNKVQVELEDEMIQKGRERYLRRQEKLSPSQREIPHQKITKALPKVSKDIVNRLKKDFQRFDSGCGKKSQWYEELVDQDPDTLAYISLNSCYESVINRNSLAGCLTAIGARVELEVWADELKRYDKGLFKRLVHQVTRDHSSDRYRLKAARIIASKAGFKFEKWDRGKKVHVAAPLLNAVLEVSGIFEINIYEKNLKTHRTISLTSEAEDILKERMFNASWA